MSYVVTARVKEALSKKGMRTGGDFVDALDKAVEKLVNEACVRCKANKRQTVYGCDC